MVNASAMSKEYSMRKLSNMRFGMTDEFGCERALKVGEVF